ncbi:MAG: arginine--tRNA ligase [Gammaproteobacteria bacterium TMED57]|jgi:arginyl-tRNA synthetase|nr:MAG: arginine--tRNA ligase [Gammaproteobacteria bacterium TMED57]
MHIRSLLSQRIEAAFTNLGLSGQALLQTASRPEFGDYQANGVMAAAKRAGKNPREVAQAVIDVIDLDGIASNLAVAGPGFINVTLAPQFIANAATTPQPSPNPQRVVVDYSGPNLAKEMHVGHLRSTIIGDCIARVLESLGHTVIRQNHVGDWGTQFGMLLTFMAEQGATSDSLADLENFYRQAKQRFDTDEDFQGRSRQAVVQLQSGDAAMLVQWQRFIEISMSHCQALYDRLGIDLTNANMDGESSYNDDLKATVDHINGQGLLTESDGAQCIFLDEFKNKEGEVQPVIVQKSDGGYLYSTSDLACLRRRIGDFKADRVLYFVDARQALHFKQVFAVAEAAGISNPDVELAHMPFGTMLGKDNKPFKTREGALVKLSELLDEAIARATKLLQDREVQSKNPDIDDAELADLAEIIGIGAVKYADLSKNRTSDYVFDWDQMLSFDGNTAPYLLYAYSRTRSIFTRGEVDLSALPERVVTENEAERRLAVAIAGYQDLLEQVAQEGYPHQLCAYLYELAGRFTQFYEQCPILTSDDATKTRRLTLTKQTGDVLANGLTLLGIRVAERM